MDIFRNMTEIENDIVDYAKTNIEDDIIETGIRFYFRGKNIDISDNMVSLLAHIGLVTLCHIFNHSNNFISTTRRP